MTTQRDLSALMGPIALCLLGPPNQALSSKTELRWGKRGSLSANLEKGCWHDHETDEGGGPLQLITREKGLTGKACFDWLREQGLIKDEPTGTGKFGKPVAVYDYTDEDGTVPSQMLIRLRPCSPLRVGQAIDLSAIASVPGMAPLQRV